MKTTSFALAAMASLALSGCANFFAATQFTHSPLSGTASGKSVLLMIDDEKSKKGKNTNEREVAALNKALSGQAALTLALDTQCSPPQAPDAKMLSALVPIVASLAEAGFNIWADKQQRKIEAIVEAAQQSYAATIALDPEALGKARCALFVRYAVDDDKSIKLGLLALLKVNQEAPPPGGNSGIFTLEPVYVRMFNAVAVTQDTSDPAVSVSVAVSIKAVGRSQGGIERLLPSGEGVVNVPKVKLGEKGEAKCVVGGSCKRSDLVPFPTARGTLSFTMSITEQGSTGFDDKAASAELAAVKAALGPAIGEAVKEKFGD